MINVKNKIRFYIKKKKWKKNNRHNNAYLLRDCEYTLISVGKYTYGGINALTSNSINKLKIGSFCSIAQNVTFVVSSEHSIKNISTFPYRVKVLGEQFEGSSKGDIIIDDDVWIGYGSIIMSGVHIGQGAVVAAGAVVTKDVPPYAIVGGVPAKVIKYRFDKNIIEELIKIDYSQFDERLIKEHIDELYLEVLNTEQLYWLPQKE